MKQMTVGLTYDLKDTYLAMGYDQEDVAEFDSKESIDALEAAIQANGYKTRRIGSAIDLTEYLVRKQKKSVDFIFNICEGISGDQRESEVPLLCEMYGIPFTFSSSVLTAISLNKYLMKMLAKDHGIPTTPSAVITNLDELYGYFDDWAITFPAFIKPTFGGSSIGVNESSRCEDAKQLIQQAEILFERYQNLLVEPYLCGEEYTVGILGKGNDAKVVGSVNVKSKTNAIAYTYADKKDLEYVNYTDTQDPKAVICENLALNL